VPTLPLISIPLWNWRLFLLKGSRLQPKYEVIAPFTGQINKSPLISCNLAQSSLAPGMKTSVPATTLSEKSSFVTLIASLSALYLSVIDSRVSPLLTV
jgi:hypothetical protein